MWGMVLMFALCCALEPTRIGVAALLIAMPRPFLNLIAFWIGLCLSGGSFLLVGMLFLSDYIRPVIEAVRSAAASPLVPPIKIAVGVLAILMAVRFVARSRARSASRATPVVTLMPVPVAVPAKTSGSDTSGSDLRAERSRVLALRSIMQGAWIGPAVERGSVRMAFVGGLATSAPPIEFCGVMLTILASGAAATTQVSAGFVFLFVGYAIAEVPLLCYLLSPSRTRAVVMRLNGWLRSHRQQISLWFFTVFGALMVAGGVGGL